MKKLVKMLIMPFLAVSIAALNGCKKEEVINLPTVITSDLSEITTTRAVSGGTVTSDGGIKVIINGVCWNTEPNPTTSDKRTSDEIGNGTFVSNISRLEPNTTYYLRAYAINRAGTAYGNELVFKTNQVGLPIIKTNAVSEISVASAYAGGTAEIADEDLEYTVMGFCWAPTPDPTTSDNKVVGYYHEKANYHLYISKLRPSTTYYVRAYATNNAGTAYGNELSFTTLAVNPIVFNAGLTYGSVADIDGNIYKTIQIGNQVWMAENLKTTRFDNGVAIPNITDDNAWSNLTSPGYCWYDNDEQSYKKTYGAIYNWYAVTDIRKLCPAGWHIPTETDWVALQTFIGGAINQGWKLKEAGTSHWETPESSGTNLTGFTAIPGGLRVSFPDWDINNTYQYIGRVSSWWSGTSSPDDLAIFWNMTKWGSDFTKYSSIKSEGMSVRCLKN